MIERLFVTIAAALPLVLLADSRAQEIIDPQVAAKNADFLLQGEYLGEGTWPGGDKGRVGLQLIALSGGKFKAAVFRGGLPGDGWGRGDDQLTMDGELADGKLQLSGKELPSGRLEDQLLSIADAKGRPIIRLRRERRTSSTIGAKPPKGAVVLFDGSNLDHFTGAKMTPMKSLEAGCNLKGKYRIERFHLEFRLSWKPKARGQGRSNSGVYLGGIPEIQVLDSFGLEGKKNQCGALYGRREPNVNMCLPPLVWQTFDIQFFRPGNNRRASVTVRHNGVVIHDKVPVRGKSDLVSGLHLQRHGNRVQYRNIWLVEAKK